MVNLQQFLLSFETADELIRHLREDKHCTVKQQKGLVLVTYQKEHLTNLEEDSVYRHLRGVIFERNTRNIVNYPLAGGSPEDTFYNSVPFDSAVVEESIDGTLISMYYYQNQWNVSTKKSIDAKCRWSSLKTFKDLFLDTLREMNVIDFTRLSQNYCYSFILCHPDNINVTCHTVPQIYHILSRDLTTLKEHNIDLGLPKPRVLRIGSAINTFGTEVTSYKSLQDYANTLPHTQEGFMLFSQDRQFRLKVFNSHFVEAATVKGNVTHPFLTLIRLLRSCPENADFMTHASTVDYLKFFPHNQELCNAFPSAVTTITKTILHWYTETKKFQKPVQIPKVFRKAVIEVHQLYHQQMKEYSEQTQSDNNYSASHPKPNIQLADVAYYLRSIICKEYFVELLKHAYANANIG